MNLRHIIARQSVLYALSFGFGQIVTIALAIYIRNALGPIQMGIWVLLQVALRYMQYTNLGLPKAAVVEIPIQRGLGNDETALRLRNASFTFLCVTSAIIFVIICFAAVLLRQYYGDVAFFSTIALAFMTFFQRISNFCLSVARAEKKFNFVNRFNIYSSLVNAGFTLLFVRLFALYGFYTSMILTFAFNCFYPIYFSKIRFAFERNMKPAMHLSKMGVSLIAVGLTSAFFNSIDKIAIGKFIGLKEAGIYSIVILGSNLLISFPQIINAIVFPYQNEAYGMSQASGEFKKLVLTPVLLISFYLSIFIAFMEVLAPYAVHLLLPKYVAGSQALKVGLFATLFMICSDQMIRLMITTKRQSRVYPISGAFGAALLVIDYLWIRSGAGIVEIAASMLLGQLLLYVILACMALEKIHSSKYETAQHIAKVLMGPIYIMAVVASSEFFIKGVGIEAVLFRLIAVSAAVLPMIFYGESQFGVLRMIGGLAFNKKPRQSGMALAAEREVS